MKHTAVSLAKAVGYYNAGVVEYLYSEPDEKFYFVELNPRLPVDHPVTKMITQVNVPVAQLQVVMCIPLHHSPEIRALYGHPHGRPGLIPPGVRRGARLPHLHHEAIHQLPPP